MVEEVYGDVLFLINFSMDFLSLYLSARLMHIPLRAWRVMLGASLGALYGVLELVLSLPRFLSFLMTAGVMLLMCLVAFPMRQKRRCLLTVLLFCGINMLIGGMMTAAFVWLGPYQMYIELGGTLHTVFGDLPIWLFAVLAALSALAAWLIGRAFRMARAARACMISIRFAGKERELSALVDSASFAEDPLSGTPVILIKESSADFLPPDLLLAMRTGSVPLISGEAYHLRFIPMQTASGRGLLLAFLPERVTLLIGKEREERRALVAIDPAEGDFGGHPALVPEILI